MGLVAKLVGIQTPSGMVVPRDTLIYYATQIPDLRNAVISVLAKDGHLVKLGLKPLPWHVRLWRRLFRKSVPALPQGT